MKKRVAIKRKSKRARIKTKSTVKKVRKTQTRKKAARRPSAENRAARTEVASDTSRNGRSTTGQKLQVGVSDVRKAQSSSARQTSRSGDHKPPAIVKKIQGSAANPPVARVRFQTTPSATSQDPVQFREERSHKIKTYLTARELRGFKELLLQKRTAIVGDVEHLTLEALNRSERGSGEQSTMPIHMADLGSDTWEQDFTLGLIAGEQRVVREIDEALERIADKSYGICVATEKPIPRDRLRAKPWAKYCIEYARLREEGRAP